MNYQLIEGDIFESNAKFIAHQCNCMSDRAAHLAEAVFTHYPWADIYSPRAGISQRPVAGEEPGNIIIRGNGKDERYVINMLAQLFPGKPKYPDSEKDGLVARQFYFRNCLLKIIHIEDLSSIAFPYHIGCGAAGGSWDVYEKLIDIFASKIQAKVLVYKLNGAE
jgi:O-acetyl-ADP-ribose deacetylase (regulator of RNase III)